jgi:hypothetical protein
VQLGIGDGQGELIAPAAWPKRQQRAAEETQPLWPPRGGSNTGRCAALISERLTLLASVRSARKVAARVEGTAQPGAREADTRMHR